MESMVERVGAELRKECLEVFGATWSNDVAWRFARAAIEAMRVPTNGMVDVGTEARWQSAIRDANSVREIWQHMIEAALKEQEKVG